MIYLRELCRDTAAVHFHLYTSAVTRDFGWYAGALMVVHHAWLLLMLICIRKCEAGSIRWVSFTADRACRLIWLINLIETSEIWRHGTWSTLVQVLTCRLSGPKPLPAEYKDCKRQPFSSWSQYVIFQWWHPLLINISVRLCPRPTVANFVCEPIRIGIRCASHSIVLIRITSY